ncbi:hypothetical protein [Paenibacillus sp. HB172176]|uniref:hypothetical protein n=1 Tax=Paenibacillus sp. HB172176 TaxID=2493690 RepID=UPI00143B637E|nr:hypothetical protein [Paenibacillus sp. HB172176]
MNNIKKIVYSILVCCIMLMPSNAFAESKISNSEENLNTFLRNAEVPEDVLSEMDFSLKKTIVERAGANFKFSSHTQKQYMLDPDNQLIEVEKQSKFAPYTIPNSDLILDTLSFSVWNSDESRYEFDIYANFIWSKNIAIDNDNYGMAIPDGWNIVPQHYFCQTYYGSESGGWNENGNCGGTPEKTELSGAAWGFNSDTWSGYVLNSKKGAIGMRVYNVDSNDDRFIANYSHVEQGSSSSPLTIGISISFLSISYTPPSSLPSGASQDEKGIDGEI